MEEMHVAVVEARHQKRPAAVQHFEIFLRMLFQIRFRPPVAAHVREEIPDDDRRFGGRVFAVHGGDRRIADP